VADNAGVKFNYVLVPEGGGLFSVCFDHGRAAPRCAGHRTRSAAASVNRQFEPMLAMPIRPTMGFDSHAASEGVPTTTCAVWPYAGCTTRAPAAMTISARHRRLDVEAERDNVEHLKRVHHQRPGHQTATSPTASTWCAS
jgi:hypothetical protein